MTGVQTCALPIYDAPLADNPAADADLAAPADSGQGDDNLDYWLKRARAAESRTKASAGSAGDEDDEASDQPSADDTADGTGADEASGEDDSREVAAPSWALPGVIELSAGTIVAGMLWTAGDEPLEVYVEAEKRWRRVPLAAALSITAVVVDERMENVWRWRATGDPQKVYTGEQYPFRRFEWTVKLADASEITGTIKGQAVHVAAAVGPSDSRILSERTKGEVGQALDDLVYARRIIISREAMEGVAAVSAQPTEDAPAAPAAEPGED